MNTSMTPQEAASMGIKLRESCDACLQAKVKCGKGRPVCNRCLTNGSACAYSPSARAGRKNRNSTGGVKKTSSNISHKRPASLEIPRKASISSAPSPWPLQNAVQDHMSKMPENGTNHTFHNNVAPNLSAGASRLLGTTTPPMTSEDEALDFGMEQQGVSILSAVEENTSKFMPTPPFHPPEYLDDLTNFDGPMSASTSLSFPDFNLSSPSNRIDQSLSTEMWIDHDPAFDPTQTLMQPNIEPNFFEIPSPTSLSPKLQIHTHPGGQAYSHHHDGSSISCDCMADCIQSLKELHIKSSSTGPGLQSCPPFDVVLQINNTAIGATSKMLTCFACASKGGIGISTMLMATMFGKALSLYRVAVHDRFGQNSHAQQLQTHGGLAFGAYRVDGEDRHLLEIEILLFELKKVERTMRLWRDKSQDLKADKDVVGVFEALSMYLEKNLHHVTEFLRQRRLELCH